MSKLEEMARTFASTNPSMFHSIDPNNKIIERALLAVFEKHVKAMLAEAYNDALYEVTDWDANKRAKESEAYAERVISELEEDVTA